MSGLSEQQRAELDAGIEKWIDRGDDLLNSLAPVVARMITDALTEQAAKVEAVLAEWESLPEPPDEDYEGTTEGHWAFGEWLATRRAARQLRAALATEGTDALAKVRADALREAAEQDAITIRDVLGYKVAAVAVEDLLDRADRIEAGDVQ